VIVSGGDSLKIDPGTTTKFATSDHRSGGSDSNKCELIVWGKLLARGTASSPITFRSINTSNPANRIGTASGSNPQPTLPAWLTPVPPRTPGSEST